jgi:hypothetical protein
VFTPVLSTGRAGSGTGADALGSTAGFWSVAAALANATGAAIASATATALERMVRFMECLRGRRGQRALRAAAAQRSLAEAI